MKVLVTWIGDTDFRASKAGDPEFLGPIAKTLVDSNFDFVLLLTNRDEQRSREYIDWLQIQKPVPLDLYYKEFKNPTDFVAIYKTVDSSLKMLHKRFDDALDLSFLISSGTPPMAIVWALIGNSTFPATLVQASPEAGVETIELPFELYAEFLLKNFRQSDALLSPSSMGLVEGDEWTQFRSPSMVNLIKKAKKAAERSLPIILEGEPGTEKKALARDIHKAGPRRNLPFNVVNCSATSTDELRSLIYADKKNHSDVLDKDLGGTLFLEEIDQLPQELQLLLETWLEKGPVPVRLIVSSSQPLIDQVTAGNFRENLFFSVAVLPLRIPPLRERSGDLDQIIEHSLAKINRQSKSEHGFSAKSLSPGAKNFLIQQRWPGNLRDLENTLRRAVVWSDSKKITEADVWHHLLPISGGSQSDVTVLSQPIESGIDLPEIMADVARHYITRAVEASGGNRSLAAKLVGLPSYQTLTNWMKKYALS